MHTFLLLMLSVTGAPASAVDVTVYNTNLGLVRDTRPFTLKAGRNELRVTDVAAQIDATSVHFKSLTAPDAVSILEQNFQYDLISQEKIMEKYLGKEIELERFVGQGHDKSETIRGTLLSNTGGRVIKSGGKLYLNPPGNPVLPELPEGLQTKPTLVWLLEARKGGEQQCEISYLTNGMGWRSDYVLVTDKDDAKLDLNAWVTINNNSGASYKDARLKLVAGDVHQVEDLRMQFKGARYDRMAAMAEAAPQFAEKSFFEYHLYTLQRPTTLRENETKQIEMAAASGVPVKKLYIYRGVQGIHGEYYEHLRNDPNYGTQSEKKVAVSLEFKNSKENHLGMPLPKGRIRVYKKDTDGSLEFIGEDSIDHTPKDEKVRVEMGNAFDLVGERKRTNYQSDLGNKRINESFEIKLRNHKDEAVTITVVERLYRWTNWRIAENSHKFTKKDAQTIEFEVPVPKDGEATITYTARYSW